MVICSFTGSNFDKSIVQWIAPRRITLRHTPGPQVTSKGVGIGGVGIGGVGGEGGGGGG